MAKTKRIKMMIIDDRSLGEAVDKFEIFQPDIVMMESKKLGRAHIDALKFFRKKNKKVSTIIVTVPGEQEHLDEALEGGASGYLLSDKNVGTLIELMRQASSKNYSVMNLVISQQSLVGLQEWERRRSLSQGTLLTEREKTILREIASGCPNKIIANNLMISEKTVKNHICSIYKKLDISNRVDAAQEAIRMGLFKVNQENSIVSE